MWVHDYHLMPLAKALREHGHKNRIGFFLHIPCPPPEMLTALPHHERLIPSLCDYDPDFRLATTLSISAGTSRGNAACTVAISTSSSPIIPYVLEPFPLGIETAAFADLARKSMRLPFVKRVIKSLGGRALIIGVDRLDYSKGISERLSAFERFLQKQARVARESDLSADRS